MNCLFHIIFVIAIVSRVYLRTVEVILQAPWNHDSLLAQAGEFFYDIEPLLFWEFSNFVAISCKEYSTDEEDFSCALNYCSLHLSFGYCDLLSFSLGLNYYSPRIQMYRQIAEETSSWNGRTLNLYNICHVFVVLCDTFIICNSSQIESYLPIDILDCNATILPFDHKSTSSQYSHTNYSNYFSAIVYGPLGNKMTLDFFEKIDNLTRIGYLAGFIYRPWYKSSHFQSPSLISGYGVELAIKNTEYRAVDDSMIPHQQNSGDHHQISEIELDGLKFEILNSVYNEYSSELSMLRRHLIEMQNDFVPLKQWQLTDLGFQSCQWLLNTFPDKGINALYGLSRLVQNLPVESKHLYLLDITDGLRREIVFNQRILSKFGIESGQSIIIFNGKVFNEFDPFSLLSFIRGELYFFANMISLGISPEDILKLLLFSARFEEMDYGIDIRHKSIFFVNNIETDAEYMSWTDNIQDLLRPTFPGVIRQVRRNFFNLLICFDPFDPISYSLLKSANVFLSQLIPIRIALLVIPNNPLDIVHANKVNFVSCLFNELKTNASSRTAFKWLLEICLQLHYTNGTLSLIQIKNIFDSFSGHDSSVPNCSVFNSSSADFIFSRGLSNFPNLFLNGIPLHLPIGGTTSDLFIDDTISIIKETIYYQTRIFQRDIYFGNLRDQMNIYNYIMTRSNIVKKLNYRILTRNNPVINFFCSNNLLKSWFDKLSSLSSCEIHQIFARETPYIFNTDSHHHLTKTHSIWLVADFSSNIGFEFLINCLRMLSTNHRTRVGLIFNYDPTMKFDLNHFLHTLLFSQPEHFLFNSILQLQYIFQYSNFTLEDTINYFSSIEGFKEDLFRNFYKSDQFYISGLNFLHYSTKILNIPRGMRGIVSNGHILGHLPDSENFNFEDFQFLTEFSSKNMENDMLYLVDKYDKFYPTNKQNYSFNLFNNVSSPVRFRSDLLLYLSTIVLKEENVERIIFPSEELMMKHSVIRVKPRVSNAYYFSLNIVVDPISKEAQKLLPISLELYHTFNIDLHVWLSPREHLSEIPINRFYKYAISGRPFFDKNGSISRDLPNIEFSDLPKSPLLNLLLDTPHVWIVEPIQSEYDLDNLDMKSDSNFIQAIFRLSHFLLEGHCFLYSSNEPVPGIQFSLGTLSEPKKFDSLVMANLGYFQFKISPGLWNLQLMEGKSDETFYISESKGNNFSLLDNVILIFSENFLGNHLQVFLTKRMFSLISKLTVLENDTDEFNENEYTLKKIWNSVSYFLPSVKKPLDSNVLETSDNVINIFSIASGHLYERFLRIMILSVLKHSKSPIKFWILKQYLSPSFVKNFPLMALKYKFSFEFVNYKWPKWLRKQDQKQREIWGYKILFLDVLFPMHIKRIIYVDADQIVRSDLLELVHIDLNKSPYGYTPFCDSRTEMDGFRFWKHGYWQNLLGNRKYHISALYVVDLFRFRELGAGDKLRGNYQALSQDPNSLANLDQDLPNSMIHSVPIFSLPQDWLWCETWCSDKDKINAKTIDICNNPLTKEPKLMAAKRIVSEWNEYDAEIKYFLQGIKATDTTYKEEEEPLVHSEL